MIKDEVLFCRGLIYQAHIIDYINYYKECLINQTLKKKVDLINQAPTILYNKGIEDWISHV